MPTTQQAQAGQQSSEQSRDAKQPAKVLHPAILLAVAAAEISETEKQRLLQLSEISIILDTYDDIFSDFDPRPYDTRSLSDDFLSEVKKAARQKGSKVELKIMVPAALRKPEQETIIKKRVKGHYRSSADQLRKDMVKMRNKGVLFVFAGVVILTLVVLMLSVVPAGITQSFLLFLFEPAGWFMLWNGFQYIFIEPSSKYDEHDFNIKMANCDISFISY